MPRRRLGVLQQNAKRAMRTWQLAVIATYANSPRLARELANFYGWDHHACKSVHDLVCIYADYGSKAYDKSFKRFAPAIFDELCLCPCHRGDSGYCDCDCNGEFSTVCLQQHHFCYECDRDISLCFGDDCACNCHEDDDCDNQCVFLCLNPAHYGDGYGSCAYNGCDHSALDNVLTLENFESYYQTCLNGSEDDDEEVRPDETITQHAAEITSAEPVDRLAEIAGRIARAAGVDFSCQQVEHIWGHAIQASANMLTSEVQITRALVDMLSDDELAYVLAHEAAHIKHQDYVRLEQFEKTGDQTARQALRKVQDDFRASGAGIVKRVAGSLLLGSIAGLAVPMAVQLKRQQHELEADQEAISIVEKSGFDPKAAVACLERFDANQLGWGSILASHPPKEMRLKRISDRVSKTK